ncbi:MAG: SHOCT domain-containing protein [Actinobacteria bacterium]|nr:SHOCT domain-containing protein [Actinomycetota bacterium]
MAAFGLHELSKQTAEEFPGLTFDDVVAPTRKRIATAVSDANLGERASKLKLPEVKRPDVKRPSRTLGIPDVRRPSGRGRGRENPAQAMREEDARLSSLERLATLHEKGVLTDEEFAAEKARLVK